MTYFLYGNLLVKHHLVLFTSCYHFCSCFGPCRLPFLFLYPLTISSLSCLLLVPLSPYLFFLLHSFSPLCLFTSLFLPCLPPSPLRMLQIILTAPQTLPPHPHLFPQSEVNSSSQTIMSSPTPVPPLKRVHPISTPLPISQHFCTSLPLLNSTHRTKVGRG